MDLFRRYLLAFGLLTNKLLANHLISFEWTSLTLLKKIVIIFVHETQLYNDRHTESRGGFTEIKQLLLLRSK